MCKKSIVAFSLSLIIFSCKDKGPSYVRGTIYERGTDKPIEGASIIIDKDKYVLAYGYKESANDDTTYSNSNGEYKIRFTRNPIARYRVKCEYPNYFTYYADINNDNEIKHGKTAINFTLIPKAFLKIRYIKTTGNSNYVSGKIIDRVDFYSPHYYSPGTTALYDITPETFYSVYGNQSNYIYWYVSEVGQPKSTTKIEGSFYVNKGDTAIYTITF